MEGAIHASWWVNHRDVPDAVQGKGAGLQTTLYIPALLPSLAVKHGPVWLMDRGGGEDSLVVLRRVLDQGELMREDQGGGEPVSSMQHEIIAWASALHWHDEEEWQVVAC